MDILLEAKYIKTDIGENNNKFWYGYLYKNNLVRSENGRVGSTGDSHEWQCSTEDEARKLYEKKCKEKEKKGYRKLDVVSSGVSKDGNISIAVKGESNLTEIAKKQIEHDSPEVTSLIERLSNANIHNIIENTTMSYNTVTGLFTTPCGIVGKETINKARILLTDMSSFIENKDFLNATYIGYLQDYLMLIPQKVGRKLDPATIYTSIKDIRKQNDILDSLESSLQSAMTDNNPDNKDKIDNTAKIFSVKLQKLNDLKEVDRIKKRIYSTMDKNHSSSHLKVKTIYSVDIESMRKEFEAVSSKFGNVSEMFHGSRVHNILSILKGGLVIPKSNASHVTGRLFGDGVYFSPTKSSKSLNYSYGYWDGKSRDNFCFLFLADVAMGKSYIPTGRGDGSYPKRGFDSVWAKEGKSGVMNDECIVYETNQCNLKYLVEFSPDGK